MRKAGGSFWIHPDAGIYHDEKVKPWPMSTILERMAYADEVTRFFSSDTRPEDWRRNAWKRAAGRAVQRSRWFHTLTGATWKGERSAARRVARDLGQWTEWREAMVRHPYPHLAP